MMYDMTDEGCFVEIGGGKFEVSGEVDLIVTGDSPEYEFFNGERCCTYPGSEWIEIIDINDIELTIWDDETGDPAVILTTTDLSESCIKKVKKQICDWINKGDTQKQVDRFERIKEKYSDCY